MQSHSTLDNCMNISELRHNRLAESQQSGVAESQDGGEGV